MLKKEEEKEREKKQTRTKSHKLCHRCGHSIKDDIQLNKAQKMGTEDWVLKGTKLVTNT